MTDIRQTENYARYLKKIGWKVERINSTNYFIKKLPLIGSIIKLQRPNSFNIKTLRSLAKKHRAIQVIIEPSNSKQELHLKSLGYRLTRSPYLPSKTLELDLTDSTETLLKNLKKDARRAIRNDIKFKSKLIRSDNIELFRADWKNSVASKRYVPPLTHIRALKESFGSNCLICLAPGKKESDNKPTPRAGAIFIKAGDITYYWQAFTDSNARQMKLQYKIVWEAILWAKSRGCRIFDFEGIYDERFPDKSWLGFTHFKKSFGGKEKQYPGCYTKFTFLRGT